MTIYDQMVAAYAHLRVTDLRRLIEQLKEAEHRYFRGDIIKTWKLK